MRRLILAVALLGGCRSSTPPAPSPEPEAKKEEGPPCGKVFRDPSVRGGSACCAGPSAALIKKSDVFATCGHGESAYLGETRDGTFCRFHFEIAGTPSKESYVSVNRVMLPPGTPAPVRPDPNIPWTWKKVDLRDALGFALTKQDDDATITERFTTLWGARGRNQVGMRASRKICTEAQAIGLLQKVVDGAR